MTETDRQRAIRLRLARMEDGRVVASLPTGFAPLDSALGTGGLPRGRIVEIFGPTCGKTTLAIQIVAHLQEGGGTAAWVDADRTFDPAYAASLDVAVDRLPVAQPESAEQAFEIVGQLAVSGAVDLVVVDSAAALVPTLELATGIGDGGPSLQGRMLSSKLRTLSAAVAKTEAAILILNQARTHLGSSGGEPATSAGGPALKLYAAIRIAMSPAGGPRAHFRILKNKVAAPFAEGELAWQTGRGFVKTP